MPPIPGGRRIEVSSIRVPGTLPAAGGEVADDLPEKEEVDQAEQLRQWRGQQGARDQAFMGF
jgi:hypothetical protein